jgi:hypothetical protein
MQLPDAPSARLRMLHNIMMDVTKRRAERMKPLWFWQDDIEMPKGWRHI